MRFTKAGYGAQEATWWREAALFGCNGGLDFSGKEITLRIFVSGYLTTNERDPKAYLISRLSGPNNGGASMAE